MAVNAQESGIRHARGQSLPGSPRLKVASRKITVGTSAASVALPKDANGNTPTFMRFAVPSGAAIYAAWEGTAVVPTTSVDGSELLFNGDVIAFRLNPEPTYSVIAEAAGTLTVTYIWS